MAFWLRDVARHIGAGRVRGRLYRVSGYPGFVPDADGVHGDWVMGDLFVLTDPVPMLARLDDYEQCSPDWPQPQEYRRAPIIVEGPGGPVQAWTYIYRPDVAGLALIAGGDFLA